MNFGRVTHSAEKPKPIFATNFSYSTIFVDKFNDHKGILSHTLVVTPKGRTSTGGCARPVTSSRRLCKHRPFPTSHKNSCEKYQAMPGISVFTLIRTDTTLDLSQKAEKVYPENMFFNKYSEIQPARVLFLINPRNSKVFLVHGTEGQRIFTACHSLQ